VVVFPYLPDGVTPFFELGKERIRLDDVGTCWKRLILIAIDLIPQKLNVLAGGTLVIKNDLNRSGIVRKIDLDRGSGRGNGLII
jgi:hypothetical protein